MTSATFPGRRAGLPSSAEEVVDMAQKLWSKRPDKRGPSRYYRGQQPTAIPGRRQWGRDMAHLVTALCDLPAGNKGLERIMSGAPAILAMVKARRAERHAAK